jgi:hypothetical protein
MTIATFHLAMVVGPSEIVRRRGSHTYCGNTRRTSISAVTSSNLQAAQLATRLPVLSAARIDIDTFFPATAN